MTTADLPYLCTYSIGDPFSTADPERACGLRAVKRVDWTHVNRNWGTVYYCVRHWSVASQFVQPGISMTDIMVGDDGPEVE